jgi:dolichol-phosphate mannosyltransferase
MQAAIEERASTVPVPLGKRAVVVVPTYNEAANLPDLLGRIMALDIKGLEVLVVDDNSPDGTAQVAEALGKKYGGRVAVHRRRTKEGLGPAYKAGFAVALESGADYVVEMDADLSHSPEYLPAMLRHMADYDVAVGSRWARGGGAEGDWGWSRKFLSQGASLYARMVLGLKVKDATTGFKCFRAGVLRGIGLESIRSQGFAFQVEVAYACQKNRYRVVEVPILFRARNKGYSKMSLGIIIEALWRVLAIRLSR